VGTRLSRPSRPRTVASLIDRHALALNEFILQIVERGIVELELPLQGAVGQAPSTLEHRDSPGRESPQRSSLTRFLSRSPCLQAWEGAR